MILAQSGWELLGTAWISCCFGPQASKRQEKTQLCLVFLSVFVRVENMIDFPAN